MEYTIIFEWDDEARVWYGYNDELPVALEADTVEHLMQRMRIAVPEMAEENHLPAPSDIHYLIHEKLEAMA